MAITPSEAFGEAVRAARKRSGLSQEEAASVAELDRSYYGHVERATYVPTLNTLWRIAGALSTTPAELIAATERLLTEDRRRSS